MVAGVPPGGTLEGHVTFGAADDGQTFQAEVIDGTGTQLFLSDEKDIYTVDTQTPVTSVYTTAPRTNPIIAGLYTLNHGDEGVWKPDDGDSEVLGRCDGLPLAAGVALSPRRAAVASSLPTFDVRFGNPVTGFYASKLILGGTADPTGVTIDLLTSDQKDADYSNPADTVARALLFGIFSPVGSSAPLTMGLLSIA